MPDDGLVYASEEARQIAQRGQKPVAEGASYVAYWHAPGKSPGDFRGYSHSAADQLFTLMGHGELTREWAATKLANDFAVSSRTNPALTRTPVAERTFAAAASSSPEFDAFKLG